MIDFIKRRYASESGHGRRAAIIVDAALVVLASVFAARYVVLFLASLS